MAGSVVAGVWGCWTETIGRQGVQPWGCCRSPGEGGHRKGGVGWGSGVDDMTTRALEEGMTHG